MILISSGLLAWNCLQVWADRSMGAATPCTVENPAINARDNNGLHGDVLSMSLNHDGLVGLRFCRSRPERRSSGGHDRRSHRALEITDLSTQIGVGEKTGSWGQLLRCLRPRASEDATRLGLRSQDPPMPDTLA